MKRVVLFFIFFIIITSSNTQSAFTYYPEEITSLDYVSYSDTEWLLSAYYYSDPAKSSSAKKYDFRNGIVIYPMNDVNKNYNKI